MSRSLRPRTERPNYALLDLGDPPGTHEPATTTVAGADSDFAPDDEADALGSDEEKGPDQEIDDEGAEDAPPISRPSASAAKGKGKARASAATSTADAPNIISQFPPGFDAPRQMYQLPQPSANHRHKAVPIFYPSGATRRLVREPVLFGANETISTNSFTNSTRVTDRLSKAIGYNVGPGPHYSLCEDRGWFKESRRDGELGDEAERRPLVYYGVKIYGEWTLLDRQNAMMYVPAELTFSCDFGPFGKQAKVTLNPLDSIALSAFSPDSQANVFYAGAPVHALDWCPIFVEDRVFCSYKYYLAVAPLSSKDHTPCVGAKVQRPAPACIQIWSLRPPAEGDPSIAAGVTRCEMVLCIESGPALDLKWCPLPSHDSLAEVSPGSPRRLGLLAGTFEDGSLSIFSVPYPEDLRQGSTNRNIPVYVRLGEPAIRIELEDAACWSFDWANSEVLAVGCTDGVVAVYDVGEALRQEHPAADILPTHYLHVHQCGVRAVSWLRAPSAFADGTSDLTGNPTVFASGGQDGLECFTDIRDPSSHTMNRTRDVVPAIPYSPYAGGPVTIDHENILKAYSASPSMLGRGHMLLEPSGPVWSVGVSDYHAQLAVGSADGTSMTTNMLRSARRGSMVPFLQHKIFQLDYNRTTGDFRMLDHFLPRELPDRSPGRLKKQSKQALGTATGAWPACIGVTRAAWNNGGGLGASGLLANATAAGLCRVDWLQGRWLKDWFPYGGVSEIRLEDGAGAMDVDDEDE